MEFKEFNQKVRAQFKRMCETGKLFKSSITGQQVWDTYLSSFKPEDNGIFRDSNSSEHNCNCCKNFIKRYGNIVAIIDGKLESIFSNLGDCGEYNESIEACNKELTNSPIQDVFFETYDMLDRGLNYEKTNKTQTTYKLGIGTTHFQYSKEYEDQYGHKNSGGSYRVQFDKVYEFNHFEVALPKQLVDFANRSIDDITNEYRTKYVSFKNTMETISIATYKEVLEGIAKKYAANSDKYIPVIESFIAFKEEYDKATDKDLFCWETSYSLKDSIAKMGSSNLGNSLLKELESGEKELDRIYQEFNRREDPENKFKTEKPSSVGMQLVASKAIEELGLVEQFTSRRHTTLDDVKANIVSFINRDNAKSKVNLFKIDTLDDSNVYNPKQFDKVDEVAIKEFLVNMDKYTSIELLLENSMSLFNMTSCSVEGLKPMFKYGNNYSFTVNGKNAGESQIKQAVKERGGNVEAVVAIRLHFPDTREDYDLYVEEPNRNIIYYGNKRQKHNSTGMLDLDAQGGDGHFEPERRVENCTWTDLKKMPIGNYKIMVNSHPKNRVNTTFYMDIELNGELTQLKLKTLGLIKPIVAIFKWNGFEFSLKVSECMELLESKTMSKKIWNLDSLKFHKVTCICLSPDHWNTNIGTLHHLFALKGAYNDQPIPTFHIDNLIPELLPNRKAIQSLMDILVVKPEGEQFAGVCFNDTYTRTIIVRVSEDSKKKVIKVQF